MNIKKLTRPIKIKAVDDSGTFEGYGSVFHVEDWYKDIVAPGAFTKSLSEWSAKGSLPPVLWQHDHGKPLGPHLEMYEDAAGLYLKGQLLVNDVALAKEAHALMKAGAVTGLSIGYWPKVEEYDRDSGVTTLKEIDLWEVSIVTFPANDFSRIFDVKSINTIRDFEKFLRESGFSKSEAVRIASKGFGRRDSVTDEEGADLIERVRSITKLMETDSHD